MFFSGSPHQRGLTVLGLLCIYFRARGDESLHGGGVSSARAVHEDGFAVEERGIRVGLGLEQFLDQRGVAIRAG